jgi:hypothetical protein
MYTLVYQKCYVYFSIKKNYEYFGIAEELGILQYNRRTIYTLVYQLNCVCSDVTGELCIIWHKKELCMLPYNKNYVYFSITEELYILRYCRRTTYASV